MLKIFLLCFFVACAVICLLPKLKKENEIHIITTMNDEDNIESRLRLAMLKYDKILVIDSGSSDDTLEIVKKMATDYDVIKMKE